MPLQINTMRSLPFGTHLHLSSGYPILYPYYEYEAMGTAPDDMIIMYEIIMNCVHQVRFKNLSDTTQTFLIKNTASGTIRDELAFHNDGLPRQEEFATIRWTAHFRSSPEAERTGTFIISFS